MGAVGKVDQVIVDETLAGPYLTHEIPKRNGHKTFCDSWSEDLCRRAQAKDASTEDCVATTTRITAQARAGSYKRWGPKVASIRSSWVEVEATIPKSSIIWAPHSPNPPSPSSTRSVYIV